MISNEKTTLQQFQALIDIFGSDRYKALREAPSDQDHPRYILGGIDTDPLCSKPFIDLAEIRYLGDLIGWAVEVQTFASEEGPGAEIRYPLFFSSHLKALFYLLLQEKLEQASAFASAEGLHDFNKWLNDFDLILLFEFDDPGGPVVSPAPAADPPAALAADPAAELSAVDQFSQAIAPGLLRDWARSKSNDLGEFSRALFDVTDLILAERKKRYLS